LSGIPDRGFIWDTKSMSDIKDAIQGNAVPTGEGSINIGDNVAANCYYCLVEGTRQVAAHAIQDRILSDTNFTAPNYDTYVDSKSGNSERVVVVPIVTGVFQASGDWPENSDGIAYGANTVIGFASFFLLPVASYEGNANAPICAEYIGPWVPNSVAGGASSGGGSSGSTGGSVPTLVD
jgi:hypothetical protein